MITLPIAKCRLPITDLSLTWENRQLAIDNRQMNLVSKPADRSSGKIYPNALHLRVKVQGVPAHFAAVA